MDDAAVQKMVEESVEHAFEDLAARRWIEARLKAEALISATRKGLTECGAELSPRAWRKALWLYYLLSAIAAVLVVKKRRDWFVYCASGAK